MPADIELLLCPEGKDNKPPLTSFASVSSHILSQSLDMFVVRLLIFWFTWSRFETPIEGKHRSKKSGLGAPIWVFMKDTRNPEMTAFNAWQCIKSEKSAKNTAWFLNISDSTMF